MFVKIPDSIIAILLSCSIALQAWLLNSMNQVQSQIARLDQRLTDHIEATEHIIPK
jgi:hypothetical protein